MKKSYIKNSNIGNLHLIEIRTPLRNLNLIAMKNTNFYGLLICSAGFLINSGCTEETISTLSPTNTIPLVSPPNSASAPSAYAGQDFQVILPTDFCWLSGGYGEHGNIKVEKTL